MAKNLSAGAGFAQGFAKGLTERLRAKREEAERIREEERSKARMLEFLAAQTEAQKGLETHRGGVELDTYKGKQEFEYGPAGAPLREQKTQYELDRARQLGQVQLDLAIQQAEEVGDIETAQKIRQLKAGAEAQETELDKMTKRMTLYTAAVEAAAAKVNAVRDATPNQKNFNFMAEWEKALGEVEAATGMQEAGISLVKPPPAEITEQLYLSTIERAVDANEARSLVQAMAGRPGAPPLSGQVKDYFMNKWGEPYQQQADFFSRYPGVAVPLAGQQLGMIGGVMGAPPLSEGARRLLPEPVARGYDIGHGTATTGMEALGATARYMAGELSLDQWLEELYAQLGILPAAGGEPVPAATPAPAAPIHPDDLPALEPGEPGYEDEE